MGRGPTQEYHKAMADGYVKGTLTCLSADYMKKNVSIAFPLVVNVEPTNACNLSCYICPRNKGARSVGYMDFGLFQKIVNECRGKKRLKMMNFHKDGEPLLHPKIYDMIRFSKDTGVAETLHMNTNALLLDETNSQRLIESGIDDVTISVDAARPETFKKIKGADRLKSVEENVRTFFRVRERMGSRAPFVRVKIMEYADVGRGEIDEFIKRWSEIADDVQVTGVHSWSGAIEGLKVTDELKPGRYPCVLMWYMVAINWDGVVSACNVDWDLSAAVGDLRKESIAQVWQGKRYKELRRAELRGDHAVAGVCKECAVWAGGEDMTTWLREKKEFYS